MELWVQPWGSPRLLHARVHEDCASRCAGVSRGAVAALGRVSGQCPWSALLVSHVQDAAQQHGEGGALLRLLWGERGAWLEPVPAAATPWGALSSCQGGWTCHQGWKALTSCQQLYMMA